MVAHAQAEVARLKLPKDRYEFQMIYGIRRDLQQEVYVAGHTLQVYVPFGTDWCPYFMRRLSERPANCWFVLAQPASRIRPAPRADCVKCSGAGPHGKTDSSGKKRPRNDSRRIQALGNKPLGMTLAESLLRNVKSTVRFGA